MHPVQRAGVVLAYVGLQLLLLAGWIVGGLYVTEFLTVIPGGVILAICVVLLGISATPNIARWLLVNGQRHGSVLWDRIDAGSHTEPAPRTRARAERKHP